MLNCKNVISFINKIKYQIGIYIALIHGCSKRFTILIRGTLPDCLMSFTILSEQSVKFKPVFVAQPKDNLNGKCFFVLPVVKKPFRSFCSIFYLIIELKFLLVHRFETFKNFLLTNSCRG